MRRVKTCLAGRELTEASPSRATAGPPHGQQPARAHARTRRCAPRRWRPPCWLGLCRPLGRCSPQHAQGKCGATTWTGGWCGTSRDGSWRTSMRTRGCGSTPSARTPSSPRSCRKWLIKRSLPCPGTAAL